MFGQSVLSAVLALYLNATFGVDRIHASATSSFMSGVFSVVLRSAFVGPMVDRLGEPLAMRLGAAELSLWDSWDIRSRRICGCWQL